MNKMEMLFQMLLNAGNNIEELQEVRPTDGPFQLFSVGEVHTQLANMGLNKECGPDDLPIEAVNTLASYSV